MSDLWQDLICPYCCGKDGNHELDCKHLARVANKTTAVDQLARGEIGTMVETEEELLDAIREKV